MLYTEKRSFLDIEDAGEWSDDVDRDFWAQIEGVDDRISPEEKAMAEDMFDDLNPYCDRKVFDKLGKEHFQLGAFTEAMQKSERLSGITEVKEQVNQRDRHILSITFKDESYALLRVDKDECSLSVFTRDGDLEERFPYISSFSDLTSSLRDHGDDVLNGRTAGVSEISEQAPVDVSESFDLAI